MATVGSRLVIQFGQRNLLAVKGVQFTDPRSLENLLGDGDDDGARSLAVEILVLEDERVAVRVDQFGAADELEVRTIDGQLLAAVDLFAVLLGEARDHGVTEREVLCGLRFVITGADDQFTAVGGDAGRSRHPDHAVADMLDIGDTHAIGEHDLADIRETGAVDGHRLAGHHLRREEHLDAQAGGVRVDDFFRGTCRERAHQDHGQQYSEICKYLFHN